MPAGPVSKRPPNAAELGCLLFFALVFSCVTLAFDVQVARSAFYQVRALGYPTATGVVTQSEVEEVREPHHPFTFRPKIRYGYTVAGKEYTRDRYRYSRWSSSAHWARRVVASHPVGSRVAVHYAPGDPSDATLLAGVDGMGIFIAMVLLPFNLVALAFCLPFGQAMRLRLQPPPLEGSMIVGDVETAVAESLGWSPLVSGAAVAGVLALVGAIGIGLAFGGAPPLSIMQAAWGVILGGGVLAYAWNRQVVRRRGGGDATGTGCRP
jgi:hypothetical protein